MKKLFILLAVPVLASCSNQPKDFSNVTTGMSKEEVARAVGEPARKNDIQVAELWTYPTQDRTVVFRADTVYDIITSAEARADSIKGTLGTVGEKVESGAKKLGGKVDSTFEKLDNQLRRDTN